MTEDLSGRGGGRQQRARSRCSRRSRSRLRLAGVCAGFRAGAEPAARHSAHPRRRDRAAAARLHAADPARRRASRSRTSRSRIINDRSFNAFVMDGRRIFVNAGALMDAKTPNEIIGVLAHETGHIAGGHLSKLRQQLAQAQTQSIIAMLLGVGAMVAAGAAAAMPAIRPPRFSARRKRSAARCCPISARRRKQADRAGVKFLAATGQSAKGMHDTFKRLSDQILFAARNADPYMQSHPMPAERVRALEELAQVEPELGQEGSAGAAAAARPDARQARRLPGSRRHGRAPLSDQRHEPAGALRARDCDLPACRPARRHRPDRRADRRPSRTIRISTS